MPVQKSEGLRARKRREAQTAIADTARRLFAEHGYDNVTVAQVAAAADVSEKTVFNHFPTKEDLAFAGREEGIEELVARIRQRPVQMSVLEVFQELTRSVIDDFVVPGHPDLLAVAKIIRQSPKLQERLTVGWESGAAAVAAAIVATTEPAGPDEEADLVASLVARTLWWTHRSIFLTALHGLLADADREQLGRRLHRKADLTYGRLAAGFAGYGRRT